MLGGKGVWVAPPIVDYRAEVVMVMEVGVHLFRAASPTTAPAASNRPLIPLLLLLLLMVVLLLLLLLMLLLLFL